MLNNNLIHLNPLWAVGYDSDEIIPEGGLGAVAAYTGVGKTALLVQLAINAMLKGTRVLHVSLNDPVNKVSIWYQEILHNLAGHSLTEEVRDSLQSVLHNRFIMTFKVEGFNAPKLEERLADIMVQNIFVPRMIILDGLKFNESIRDTIVDLKSMAKKHSMRLWFTVPVHRSEESNFEDMPQGFVPVADLFDVVFKLQPEEGRILIRSLKGAPATVAEQPLFLDPSSMLINRNS